MEKRERKGKGRIFEKGGRGEKEKRKTFDGSV
jgi:hypothetical protein